MIKLSVNSSKVNKRLNLTVESIGQMKDSFFLEEIAKATFTIVGERFVLAVDRFAVQNPKKMHHVYEWQQIGNPRARLFVIERLSTLKGSLIINSSFIPSKMPVPINPELLVPGKTGKYVNKKNIFKNKADVMEKGLPIQYTASNILAFAGRTGIMFLRPGAMISIKNPGGISTKNSFSSFMLDWYNGNAQSIMNSSGIYEKIANEASVIIERGGGIREIKNMASQIGNLASRGLVEIK
jgi:hypothetical protein